MRPRRFYTLYASSIQTEASTNTCQTEVLIYGTFGLLYNFYGRAFSYSGRCGSLFFFLFLHSFLLQSVFRSTGLVLLIYWSTTTRDRSGGARRGKGVLGLWLQDIYDLGCDPGKGSDDDVMLARMLVALRPCLAFRAAGERQARLARGALPPGVSSVPRVDRLVLMLSSGSSVSLGGLCSGAFFARGSV